DAQIIPAVLGTRSELLDLGHAHRLAKPGLVTALELRDKTCTYPGCRIPAAWTDKHHITHWANGGPTTKGNTCCLCRHHHTVVHRHGHVATVTPTGVTWTRADGTPIGNQPRPGDTSLVPAETPAAATAAAATAAGAPATTAAEVSTGLATTTDEPVLPIRAEVRAPGPAALTTSRSPASRSSM
ncbi:hypothetical protein KILIM_061_00370, partial [Kineosphaera limosa NBRC 100340]